MSSVYPKEALASTWVTQMLTIIKLSKPRVLLLTGMKWVARKMGGWVEMKKDFSYLKSMTMTFEIVFESTIESYISYS